MTRVRIEAVRGLRLWVSVWALCAACDDFPQQPPLGVTLEVAGNWPDTMNVTDTVTVDVTVTETDGAALEGLFVDWSSSRPAILTVSKLTPPESIDVGGGQYRPADRRDTLAAQLKGTLTARGSGEANVLVTLIHPAFRRAEAKSRVVVMPWPVAPDTSWPEVMTVTETTTVSLAIRNANPAFANELRVQWQSSNEAVLQVARAIPPQDPSDSAILAAKLTATFTAHRSGSAEIVVTVERPDFEPSEVRRSIQVEALKIVPQGTWPNTLMVGDNVLLRVAVKNHQDSALAGRDVEWQSSDSRILTIEESSPTSATVRAQRRGSAAVYAIVHPDGFERAATGKAVPVMERWRSVSAGTDHTCGIASDSTAYCWGTAVGNSRPDDSDVPVPVLGLGELKFLALSAGDSVTCGIVVSVRVAYCWGFGSRGRLGNGDPSERNQFVPVPVSGGVSFRQLSTGQANCALSDNFEGLCWGSNEQWQLGRDLTLPPPIDTCRGGIECSATPQAVVTVGTHPDTYSSIDVGGRHTCGISRSPDAETAFCWGSGLTGALGDGRTVSSREPLRVLAPFAFRQVSSGGDHTCGITTDSLIAYCWGSNSNGQLGAPAPETCSGSLPCSKAPISTRWTFESLAVGGFHTCGIHATSKTAYCWGRGGSGQLGNDETVDKVSPSPVTGSSVFESLSAGESHTCGVTDKGAAYCWGKGAGGRLGNGSLGDRDVPFRVSEPP